MQSRISLKMCAMIVIISAATAIGLNNIISLINLAAYSEKYQKTAELLYTPSFGMQILYYGLAVPIIEELIFRGIFFQILRKWIPFVGTMILSAVLFGVYHGNLVQFVYASICGLLLAYFCEVCHSLIASIFSHMTMNIVVCTLVYIGGFGWMMDELWKTILFTGVCVVIAVWGIVFTKKRMLQKC